MPSQGEIVIWFQLLSPFSSSIFTVLLNSLNDALWLIPPFINGCSYTPTFTLVLLS